MTSDVLNLGCGRKKMPGAVNVDISAQVGADVVHNLAQLPWPLPSDTFREVHAMDVIEHLDDTLAAMGEIHRVCRGGALVHITVPHFSSANAFTDPTHRKQFSYFSFDYFDPAHQFAFYSQRALQARGCPHRVRAQPLEQARPSSGQSQPTEVRAAMGLDVSGVVSVH